MTKCRAMSWNYYTVLSKISVMQASCAKENLDSWYLLNYTHVNLLLALKADGLLEQSAVTTTYISVHFRFNIIFCITITVYCSGKIHLIINCCKSIYSPLPKHCLIDIIINKPFSVEIIIRSNCFLVSTLCNILYRLNHILYEFNKPLFFVYITAKSKVSHSVPETSIQSIVILHVVQTFLNVNLTKQNKPMQTCIAIIRTEKLC